MGEKTAEKQKKQAPAPKVSSRQKRMLCDGLSFAAAEAYKLLRTNLLFTLPEKPCRIIGITSSVQGEGKSTTSVNLAYTIAQTGKKILLIESDLRLPSLASKLGIQGTPGLSNLLVGWDSERDCLRPSGYFDNWFILPAGDIPPNPSELLGSDRMQALIRHYEKLFDFIILDLPPVNIVTDALVISKWTDGLLLTVRQNYTDKKAFNACLNQIRKLETKFLGFVMTDSTSGKSSYGKYSKYGKYGKYSKKGYGYGSYAKSSGKASKQEQAFFDAVTDSMDQKFEAPEEELYDQSVDIE